MRKCPKFIIVRVQGKCVGGGVGIAAAADYAIAVEGADVSSASWLSASVPLSSARPSKERSASPRSVALPHRCDHVAGCRMGKRRGLYAELHGSVTGMDESIVRSPTNWRIPTPKP